MLGQHVYSILKREDRASRYSPFACTLHAGYAKQVMHVSVPLPPEKANSDALVLGSWQMQHIHTSRQSARNYSKRCTLSSLMHPHGDAWASSVPSRTSIYVVPLPPGHLDACVVCLAQIAHSHRSPCACIRPEGLGCCLYYNMYTTSACVTHCQLPCTKASQGAACSPTPCLLRG